jgi:hypothetical protein
VAARLTSSAPNPNGRPGPFPGGRPAN